MSDQRIAYIARQLAVAFSNHAHSRSAEDSKMIAVLKTELVQAVLDESNEDEHSDTKS